jgi:hypothetical protein
MTLFFMDFFVIKNSKIKILREFNSIHVMQNIMFRGKCVWKNTWETPNLKTMPPQTLGWELLYNKQAFATQHIQTKANIK